MESRHGGVRDEGEGALHARAAEEERKEEELCLIIDQPTPSHVNKQGDSRGHLQGPAQARGRGRHDGGTSMRGEKSRGGWRKKQ